MKIFKDLLSWTSPEFLEILKRFPFELSPFQKNAIIGLLQNKHILITAHTGSGKTLPAEVAIEYFVSKGKRVIYTSPIKALTNQKFHEFSEKFPHISFGILTGDNKFNPDAQCLLMTQEILRNTLFQKKLFDGEVDIKTDVLSFEMDIDNELGCVIIDEAHSINDRDRGRVWEETYMMLPVHVQLLMLSATLAKPEELCEFLEKRGGPEVWICPTDKRVVPLTHYGYITMPNSNFKTMSSADKVKYQDQFNKLVTLKNPDGTFSEESYNKLKKTIRHLELKRIHVNKYFVINEAIQMLKKRDALPAIIFVFSRKQVDIIASKIQIPLFDKESKIPSIIEKECESLLRRKLTNYKEYLVLPEYRFIIGLLRKGIAVHHAGILKEFREMIELVFKKGYVKILVATETFAVGINMPTKTTIFTSIQKFDGKSFRFLLPHEYVQMGGRAGRRGIDTKGNVLLLLNLFSRYEVPVTSLRHMLTGAPQSIQSKFSIHANLILRLISVKNYDFRGFMEKSMITKNIESSRKVVLDKLDNFKKSGDTFYRTSNEILEKMHELKTSVGNLRGNKKKKRLREITILEQSNKFVVIDYDRFVQNMVRDITVKQLKNEILNIDSFIDEEIGIQISMLIENKFIIKDGNNLLLTEKGNLAINIQELSSLAMGEILNNRCFDDLDSIELASIISCFTNLHLSDDQSVLVISSIQAPEKVKEVISKVKNTYNKYFDILTKLKLDIVENYQMHFNMVELTIKWCNAEDNVACMKIIQEAKSFDISLGDFVKAILKINNISQELEKAAVVQENLGLLEKLKNISQITLKSCITNQSLYL
tara:strand:+ start:3680 stop:6145 length:2466 start_codon:yes stop_codon:yes gene_type:complete